MSRAAPGQDGAVDWLELLAAVRPYHALPQPPASPSHVPDVASGGAAAAAPAVRETEEECVRRRGEGAAYRAVGGECGCGEGFKDGPEGPEGPCVPDWDKACQVRGICEVKRGKPTAMSGLLKGGSIEWRLY
jgi:hypothetical protein